MAVQVQLGITLRNHAEVLREVSRAADARPYSIEALELYRKLARHSPEALESELRLAVYVHGRVLVDLDRAAAIQLLNEGLQMARHADDQEMGAHFVVALEEASS
jgi:hypothetical protein